MTEQNLLSKHCRFYAPLLLPCWRYPAALLLRRKKWPIGLLKKDHCSMKLAILWRSDKVCRVPEEGSCTLREGAVKDIFVKEDEWWRKVRSYA